MTFALIANLAYGIACICAIVSKDYALRVMVLVALPLVLHMNLILYVVP
jgi:hypothetical protein